jgi:hypothetical protein
VLFGRSFTRDTALIDSFATSPAGLLAGALLPSTGQIEWMAAMTHLPNPAMSSGAN